MPERTTERHAPPSLAAMAARTGRIDEGLLALRRKTAELTVTARDGHDLVEVTADGRGEIVDVALNSTLVARVGVGTLAAAVLQATRQAQRDVRAEIARLRAYHLGG